MLNETQQYLKTENISSNSKIKVCTHLKEVYEDYNERKDEIEPIYETMRSKFKTLYKQELEFNVRIPYVVSLFGDQTTSIFEDKIVTSIDKDLIIFICKNNSQKLIFNTFDTYSNPIEINLDDSRFNIKDYPTEFKFFFTGFQSGLRYIRPNDNTGISVLVYYGITDFNSFNLLPSIYLGGLYLSCYLYGKTDIPLEIISEKSINDLISMGIRNPSSIILSQLYSEKGCISWFSKNRLENFKLGNSKTKLSLLLCDSLSKEVPLFYSNLNHSNKRLLEYKLGMFLVLKRFKKNMNSNEILDLANNFKKFVTYFEENLDTIFGLFDNFLKKDSYKLKDLKEELGDDIKLITNTIPNSEMILMRSKDFFLYKRITYVFKEYEIIKKVVTHLNSNNTQSTDEKESKLSINKFISFLNESANNLQINYECYSDEMNNLANLKIIDKTFRDSNCGVKLISQGWTGSLLFLGEENTIKLVNQEINKYLEKIEENGETVNIWISDDISRFCFTCKFGGSSCLINPIYEDFYILDSYENIQLQDFQKKTQIQETNDELSQLNNLNIKINI